MGKQIGPFPLAGWLGIGAAGIGVAVLATRRRSPSLPAAVQPYAIDMAQPASLPEGAGQATAGGDSGAGGPTWSDVFDAWHTGVQDAQAMYAQQQPASWDVPTTAPSAGTTEPLVAAEVPVREPIAPAPSSTVAPAAPPPVQVIDISTLPRRNATTDRSITTVAEDTWTARQRAYADMYGLSGTKVAT